MDVQQKGHLCWPKHSKKSLDIVTHCIPDSKDCLPSTASSKSSWKTAPALPKTWPTFCLLLLALSMWQVLMTSSWQFESNGSGSLTFRAHITRERMTGLKMSLVSLPGSGHWRWGGGFNANLNRSVMCSISNRHKKKPFVFEVYVCARCCSGRWLDYSLEFNTQRCGEITVTLKCQHKYSTLHLFRWIKGYLKRCDFPFNGLDSVDSKAKR